MAVWASQATAQSQAVSENAMKAVLFYKLPQFVYLPDERRAHPMMVCAMGGHPIVSALEKLAGTSTEARPAVFQMVASASEASRCDFLFIPRSETANFDAILHRLESNDVVTVSDIPGFAKAGGMIEFTQHPERTGVQILINRRAARQQGIEFNAQLLRLAKIVEP